MDQNFQNCFSFSHPEQRNLLRKQQLQISCLSLHRRETRLSNAGMHFRFVTPHTTAELSLDTDARSGETHSISAPPLSSALIILGFNPTITAPTPVT
ncbi:hypothetical protein PAPYR_10698 [Paratrimastix pyriformis]|uniref:Uncharacterized protein n=1 Tax=Paratrimastix pyriformis TaxID=342808 RepID=A0ABQ8UB16_9EUKA|nr:hypothetical protein PAPYR_10698 [Paratrimastix pyriformis]